jgi:hypothetical protein
MLKTMKDYSEGKKVLASAGYEPAGMMTACYSTRHLLVIKTSFRRQRKREPQIFYEPNIRNSTTVTKVSPLFHFSFLLAISWCVLRLAICEGTISALSPF